jgi:6,7-dimethyl-8-ribityllumazine synthase
MATANNNLSAYDKSTVPNAKNLRFGIVVSQWNSEITDNLYQGAVEALLDCGAIEDHIVKWDVPGSFELVYGAKKMIGRHDPDVIIVIGSVIQGETKHFDFVCQATANGVMDLNVLHETPVIFCVLTDNTMQQAIDRSGGKHGNKGVEAAIAAINMAVLGRGSRFDDDLDK